MNNLSLPIFPLQVFLLPAGKMRLRIFEPRYIKLISIASTKGGFVIQPRVNDEDIDKETFTNQVVGSLVEVHDFNQGEDGILEVDVFCRSLVEISNVVIEGSLTFGSITPLTHWSEQEQNTHLKKDELALSLNTIIQEDMMLNSLYQDKKLMNETWVVARWLELLPINITLKNSFIYTNGFEYAKGLVESIVNK